jgi:predicted secreted protein
LKQIILLPQVFYSSEHFLYLLVIGLFINKNLKWRQFFVGELNNIEFVSKEYQPSEPITTGSGGIDVWTFKAINSGEAQITLGYYPPFEEPEPPQQTITFDVKIK